MIRKTLLDNGIRVITEKMPGVHSVSVGFWIQSGSRQEPPQLNGLSHFLEHMLFKGSARRSARQIAREINSVGGQLNGFTSREFCCFYAKVMTKQLPMALALLADIVLHPRLDPVEMEKERRVILQELTMVEDSPDDHIHDLFSELFWKDHPLGRPTAGTIDSVQRISRADLLSILSSHYCGTNLIVCAAGGIDHNRVVDEVSQCLGDFPAGSPVSLGKPPEHVRRIRLERWDCEQVHLCLGTRALAQNHPDRFTGFLLNAILGGGISSRLFEVIRDERAMAYSIYSYLGSHSDDGSLVIYSATAPRDTSEAIRLMLAECRKLKEEPVPEVELISAREQLKGSLLLSLESTDNRMTRLAKNELYLSRQVPVDKVLESFDAVDAEAVMALARELFTDKSLTLQLLGRIEDSGFPLIDLTLN